MNETEIELVKTTVKAGMLEAVAEMDKYYLRKDPYQYIIIALIGIALGYGTVEFGGMKFERSTPKNGIEVNNGTIAGSVKTR
jgi:hypothetical protein